MGRIEIWCLVAVALTCAAPFARAKAKAKAAPVDFQRAVLPVLSEYCFGCHNDGKHKGDVILTGHTNETSILADRAMSEKVLKNLRSRAMPPEDKPQPSEAQRKAVETWLDATLYSLDCDKPDPGRVTIRRLNRVEYNNTIRDLVGVDFQPAEDFPADDVGYGFDNIGDVLSMPPVLLEKYLAAAERILDAAIVVPGTRPRARRFPALAMNGTGKDSAFTSTIRGMSAAGEIFTDQFCATAGDYVLRVRAFQTQAGDEPARLALRAGGMEVKTFEVRAAEDRPQIFEATVALRAGTNRFAVAFLNPFSSTNKPDPNARRQDQAVRIKPRRLMVDYLEVIEPGGVPAELPETHTRLFAGRPRLGRDEAAAREIIGRFARRAFRRPVTAEELDRLMRLFALARTEGEPFERGVQLALQAVLVSPHFLFRGEIAPEPNNPKSVHLVNEFALASRLSYFLWSSMPDEELLALAEGGGLRKRGGLEAQVKRMLKNPKSGALVRNFTGQWLQTRNLWRITPDTNVFATFTDALRADLERETDLFFENAMREDRSVLDFIDGRYTFVNERLARHYGIAGVTGEEFQKVSFRDKARGGVLTHGAVLAITSNPTRTSPVKRGKWVLDNLLGTPPPPPPPDVPDLKDQKELTGTLRQKMEQHRQNPNCASCHERMDPIGFGLENFNAVGVWRDRDEGLPIDPSGRLPGGQKFSGPEDLRKILRAQKDLFAHCLAEKMLTYALGRGLEYYDKCAVDGITTALANKGYKFSVLIAEIVKSAPFQMRRGDSDGEKLTADAK